MVANELSMQHSHFPNESIVVIISPLVALMKDQVSVLKSLDIRAEFVAADQVESVLKDVEARKHRLVYTSPESMLEMNAHFIGLQNQFPTNFTVDLLQTPLFLWNVCYLRGHDLNKHV